jgi:hypothetical protein
MAANHAGEARDGFDLEVGDVLGEIEPHDAEPGEMPAAAALPNALPGLAIRLLREASLIGDDMDLDAVNSAEQSLANDATNTIAPGLYRASQKCNARQGFITLSVRRPRRISQARFLGARTGGYCVTCGRRSGRFFPQETPAQAEKGAGVVKKRVKRGRRQFALRKSTRSMTARHRRWAGVRAGWDGPD